MTAPPPGKRRDPLVPLAAVLLIAAGALTTPFGLAVTGISLGSLLSGAPEAALFVLIRMAILSVCVLEIVTGIAMFLRRPWARVSAIALAGLGIAVAALTAIRTVTTENRDLLTGETFGPNWNDLGWSLAVALVYGLVLWAVVSRRRYLA